MTRGFGKVRCSGTRMKWATWSIGTILVVVLGVVWLNSEAKPPEIVWTMVNVNDTQLQGDAHLIQVRDGAAVLIDAGYRGSARKQLIPYLAKHKISGLDAVFITHPHKDHYEGLSSLLEAGIRIREVFFNIPDKQVCDKEKPWGCDYADVLRHIDLVKQKGIPVRPAAAGDRLDLGRGVRLDVLYAFDGIQTPVGATDVNDLSLIMVLTFAGGRFLFTGDLNQAIGGYLAKHAKDITADVIKVPHHGTESVAPDSFFAAVGAKHALIPSPAGLWCTDRSARIRKWFEAMGVPVYVNGHAGHVRVEVRDGTYRVVAQRRRPLVCS